MKLRFEFDRNRILQLLSSELYDRDLLAFARELLQNSVDAIDAREALLRKEGASLHGHISVHIITTAEGLEIEWRDNGIGMDEKILQSFFCKLGCSWYQSRDAQQLAGLDAISQFGVGVLSCFAVSDGIQIETRRDPGISDGHNGLRIDIPSRDSHFRVRKLSGVPVGTLVRLRVGRAQGRQFTKNTLCAAIVRISRFVRHRVTVDSDGVLTYGGIASLHADATTPIRTKNARALAAIIQTTNIELGDVSGDYHGRYTALYPTNPAAVVEKSGRCRWEQGETFFDVRELMIRSEQSLFLKGVQAGAVNQRPGDPFRHGIAGELLDSTVWATPSLLLNLTKPSLAHVNLSKSEAHAKDELVRRVRADIARKIAPTINGGLGQDPARNALILGSMRYFGGIPWEGLAELLPPDDIPALVLSANRGLRWLTLGELTNGKDFIDAPFELYQAWSQKRSIENGWPCRWAGQDALVPRLFSQRHPWLADAVGLAPKVLRTLGWHPTALQTVTSPSTEDLPLVCRQWRRDDAKRISNSTHEARATLYGRANNASPELLDFPDHLNRYAAFGSKYWNRNHKKIQSVVAVLTELQRRCLDRETTDDLSEAYDYLTHRNFNLLEKPSRVADHSLAISFPNRVIDLARQVGISSGCHLSLDDFYPGTVGEYLSPYTYPLDPWVSSEAEFGTAYPHTD